MVAQLQSIGSLPGTRYPLKLTATDGKSSNTLLGHFNLVEEEDWLLAIPSLMDRLDTEDAGERIEVNY